MTQEDLAHDRISPTAKLVAYWRQYSDLPFSGDIAKVFKVEEVMNSMFKGAMPFNELLVAMVEIRYKSIQNFILKSGIKQVLEFASGVSLRGLAMTEDPTITYVETDLEALTHEKLKLLRKIMEKNSIPERKNLFFHSVNILKEEEIELTLQHFDPDLPLLIVHEGLFQYLSIEEKAIASRNIHSILSRFKGLWITPDFETKETSWDHFFTKEIFQPFIDAITRATGRNVHANNFADDAELIRFFNTLGFDVEWTSQLTKDFQVSAYKNKSMSQEVLKILSSLRLWIMHSK